MKIVFEKLQTSSNNVYVDFGDGTWQAFPVNEAKDNGINIPASCSDYSKIRIKGSTDVFPNLDVITSIKQTIDPIYKDVYITQGDNGDYIMSIDENADRVFSINNSGLPFTIENRQGDHWYGFVRLKDNPNLLMGLYEEECRYLKMRELEHPIIGNNESGRYIDFDDSSYYIYNGDYVDLGSYQVGVVINGSVATLDKNMSLTDYSSADIIMPEEIPETFFIRDDIYADNIDTYIEEVIENKPLCVRAGYYSKETNILAKVIRQNTK